MRISSRKINLLSLILLLITASLKNQIAYGADSYNLDTGILNIPLVAVADKFYEDVNVTLNSVVRDNESIPKNGFDIYDLTNQELKIPYVQVGEDVYRNIVVKIEKLISFKNELPSLESLSFSAEIRPAQISTFVPKSDLWTQGLFSHYTDLNNDGSEDIIIIDSKSYEIRIFVNTDFGMFSEIQIAGDQMKSCSEPAYATSDFNGDDLIDIIIFCKGFRGRPDPGQFTGEKPVYLVNIGEGGFKFDSSLSDSYSAIEENPKEYALGHQQKESIISAKNISVADIDNDGDIDLWVESKGGLNVSSHFLINGGDGHFKIETYDKRMDWKTYSGEDGACNRFLSSEFLDINGDGYQDLILGQLRNSDIECQNLLESKLLLNDGTGNFYYAGRLPHPNFNDGFTGVQDIGIGNFDNNEFRDLILLHVREGSAPEDKKYQAFYIQALRNNGNNEFSDITDSLFSELEKYSVINPDYPARLRLVDYDKDGYLDIALNWFGKITESKPPLFLFDSSLRQFRPVDFSNILKSDEYFGSAMQPVVNELEEANGFMYIRPWNESDSLMLYLPISIYGSNTN